MKILLYCFLILSGPVLAQNMQRVPLKLSDAFQTSNAGQDITNLIDGDRSTRFNPGYHLMVLPHNVIIDLSDYAPCTIKRFVLWDGGGHGYNCQFILVNAVSEKEDTIYTFRGDNYMKSDTIDIPLEKQYPASKLIIRSADPGDGYPDDMELWGQFSPHSDPVWNMPKSPIKNQLGVVAHPWDIDLLSYPQKFKALKDLGVSDIRLYSDANTNKDLQGNYSLNPELRGFQSETAFAQLQKDRPEVLKHICYQSQTLQIKQTWPSNASSQLNFEYQYYSLRDSVSSYKSIARDLFVLATRGGKNKSLPDYPIHIPGDWWVPRQQMVKGEGFYDLIEGGNEWDAWWTGSRDTYMTGSELAAAWSMMYDGHKKKYADCGVKQADANVLFTNGGIASDRPDTFREAVEWWKKNRGFLPDGSVDIPLDFYSYHSYSSVNGQYGGSQGGIPPELGMIPQARNMVYFSNKYGGRKGVIIGEWGWDVNQGSPLNAPIFNGHSAEQTRAWWAIRAILKFTEVGIYRAEWFQAFQDYYTGDPLGGNYANDNNPTQFATMALLRQEDDAGTIIKRTLVGDYFRQISEFGDYVFDSTIRSDSINVLRFKKDTNYAYAVWAVEGVTYPFNARPIFSERTGRYNLQVPLNAIVKIRSFADDESGIMQSRLDMAAGYDLPIDYSAKPLLVQVVGQGNVLPIQLISFSATPKRTEVIANWSVENEEALNYIVERSTNAHDYFPIASVKATGQQLYQVMDPAPVTGNNYYRLKITDKTGSVKYSPVRLAVVKKEKVKYAAYSYLGQLLSEGEDLIQVDRHAKQRLKQRQGYVITGSDGSILKRLKQYN